MSSVERQIHDVLEAVNAYASHTDAELADVRTEMRAGFVQVRSEISEIKVEISEIRFFKQVCSRQARLIMATC